MSKDSEKQPLDGSDYLQRLSEEFDALTELRHEVGAKEYGPATFLKVPLIRFAAEELADLANYARYLYIKLRVLEEVLDASGVDLSTGLIEEVWESDEVSLGLAQFIPAEKISGFLSQAEREG